MFVVLKFIRIIFYCGPNFYLNMDNILFFIKYILVQSSNRSALLILFFRKHKIENNLKKTAIKQVIIHLSKLLTFIFKKIIM